MGAADTAMEKERFYSVAIVKGKLKSVAAIMRRTKLYGRFSAIAICGTPCIREALV